MNSSLYVGKVLHSRKAPTLHAFKYDVFMMYADLDEIDALCCIGPLWKKERRIWPASFCRQDFHGDPSIPLKQAVQKTIHDQLGVWHQGPIFMLANWRYFGFNMNPLVVYYCYDVSGETSNLKYIVAEVTNTPWRERQAYVQRCDSSQLIQTFEFPKRMHVSPFNDMNVVYHWRSTTPKDELSVSIENCTLAGKNFKASMHLRALPVTASNLRRILIFFPLMTVKVIGAIYWQAFKLWLKKVPVFPHPNSIK